MSPLTSTVAPTLLDASLYIPELRTRRKDSVLAEMVGRAHEVKSIRGPEILVETLMARERLGTTGIGKSVAIPNVRSITVLEPRLVVARSRRGIAWGSVDDQLVHLILMALSQSDITEEIHHAFVARAAAAVRLQRSRQKLLDAESFEVVAQLLKDVTL